MNLTSVLGSQRLHRFASQAVCGLAFILLSSCGGGTITAFLPGTGGTGIVGPTSVTAMGPVRGFGSVIVNGIRFEDSGADVRLDDLPGDPGALRLGMTAKVLGTLATTTSSVSPTAITSGAANSIEIWSAAQGVVSNIQLPGTITVAGMTLVVDAGTVFVGVESLAGLRSDSVVKVWGLPSSVDFTQWTVTRLELLKPTLETVSTGKAILSRGQWTLNGLTLANVPDGLVDGQLVRVLGTLSGTGPVVLTATKTTLLAEAGSTLASTGYAESQGIVSSISATRLTLGASVVDITSASVLPAGTTITQGMRIQVQGEWSSGVLLASQVKIITEQELKTVDVEGVIEAMAGIGNITVRGQRFDATGLAIIPAYELALDGLRAGMRVRIVGVKKDNLVVASSIERK